MRRRSTSRPGSRAQPFYSSPKIEAEAQKHPDHGPAAYPKPSPAFALAPPLKFPSGGTSSAEMDFASVQKYPSRGSLNGERARVVDSGGDPFSALPLDFLTQQSIAMAPMRHDRLRRLGQSRIQRLEQKFQQHFRTWRISATR